MRGGAVAGGCVWTSSGPEAQATAWASSGRGQLQQACGFTAV